MDEERRAVIEEKARFLDSRLRMLRENLERTAQAMMELEIAKNGIREMEKGNKEVMMGLGSGVMAKAKITNDNVVTPVGSSYFAVLPYNKAVEKIEKHIVSAKSNQEKINEEVKRVEKELVGLLKEARGSNV